MESLKRLIYLLFFLPVYIFASDSFDSSFNQSLGYITISDLTNSIANKIKLQSSGKLIVVGFFQNPNRQAFVARYNLDGSQDNTFGDSGLKTLNAGSSVSTTVITDLAIQTDDSIVVTGYTFETAGTTKVFVAKYTSSGVLDTTFGLSGISIFNVGSGSNLNSIVMQSDGKIVVAGATVINGKPNALIARLTSTGSLDSGFGSGGVITALLGVRTSLNSVKLDSLSRIVVTGFYSNSGANDQLILARFNTNGTIDSTFASGGVFRASIGSRSVGSALAIDNSGNIFVGGFINSNSLDQFVLAKFSSSGTIDTTFNSPNGYLSQAIGNGSYLNDVAIQSNNKIVVSGYVNSAKQQATLARYNTDGTNDSTFGTQGVISWDIATDTQFNGIVIQSADQKVIAVGNQLDSSQTNSSGLIARFKNNNTSFVNFNSPLVQNAVINSKIPNISGTSSGINAQVQIVINGSDYTTVSTDALGNWNAGVSSILPLGTNYIQANLIVSGATVSSNQIVITILDNLGEDSVFAYSTTSQTTTSTNTFQTISFLNPPPIINTWTFDGTNTFTCKVAGKYLVGYSCQTGISTLLGVTMNASIRALLNSSEITGSQSNNFLSLGVGVTGSEICSKDFIVNLNIDDTIQFQYATDASGGGIISGTGNGITKPSVSIVITRLQ